MTSESADGLDRPPSSSTPSAGEQAPLVPPVRFRLRTLTILFMAEALLLALAQLPLTLDFNSFVHMDQGANLTVQRLLDRGRVPITDFGYQYGLATLLIGRAWFALFGRTPVAYAGAMVVVDLLIAWGLARCAYALRSGLVGIALFVCTVHATAMCSYINLAHACEAVLICHALAEHASGRRPRALALLTAALFIKPVMAYLYGFLLIVLIVRNVRLRGLVPSLVPAAITGILLFVTLAVWFGFDVVIQSLLPLRGADSYKQLNYGFFFGVGRRFWLPQPLTPRYYIFSPAGHYLVGSVVLFAAAVPSIWRLVRKSASTSDSSKVAFRSAKVRLGLDQIKFLRPQSAARLASRDRRKRWRHHAFELSDPFLRGSRLLDLLLLHLDHRLGGDGESRTRLGHLGRPDHHRGHGRLQGLGRLSPETVARHDTRRRYLRALG